METPQATSTSYSGPTLSPATLSAYSTLEILITVHPDLARYNPSDCLLYPCFGDVGLSPNGEWATFFNVKEGDAGMVIVSTDGEKRWEVYYPELTGWSCGGCDARVTLQHWSQDGKYLYLSYWDGSDGGPYWFWREGMKLFRFYLNSGHFIDTGMGSAFSFSSNDRYIAYRADNGVHVHEFQTGNEKVFLIPKDYINFGNILWSPDSRSIVVTATKGETLEKGYNEYGFSIFLINIVEEAISIIIEDDMRFLYPIEWEETNLIILDQLHEIERYQLRVDTMEISPLD